MQENKIFRKVVFKVASFVGNPVLNTVHKNLFFVTVYIYI